MRIRRSLGRRRSRSDCCCNWAEEASTGLVWLPWAMLLSVLWLCLLFVCDGVKAGILEEIMYN